MSTTNTNLELWLIRHGETEWSASGKHTSRSDVLLTARGQRSAQAIGRYLAGRQFSMVLTSPRQRAQETCNIAGYSMRAVIDENLAEWDYGNYEGRTTAEIRSEQADWSIWSAPVPGGESIERVAKRAESVIDRAEKSLERPLTRSSMDISPWTRGSCPQPTCWRASLVKQRK